jgi:hypothetical protein
VLSAFGPPHREDEIKDLGPLEASCRLYLISNITLLRVAMFVGHVWSSHKSCHSK